MNKAGRQHKASACVHSTTCKGSQSGRHASQNTSLDTLLCRSLVCMHQQMGVLVGICRLAHTVSPFVRPAACLPLPIGQLTYHQSAAVQTCTL